MMEGVLTNGGDVLAVHLLVAEIVVVVVDHHLAPNHLPPAAPPGLGGGARAVAAAAAAAASGAPYCAARRAEVACVRAPCQIHVREATQGLNHLFYRIQQARS